MLVHTVFFTLKPDATQAQRDTMLRMAKAMGTIETVKALYLGKPAPVEKRPVTRDDYHVCLTVLFETVADHDVYQVHQLHQDYIATNKEIWAKVEVFDAM